MKCGIRQMKIFTDLLFVSDADSSAMIWSVTQLRSMGSGHSDKLWNSGDHRVDSRLNWWVHSSTTRMFTWIWAQLLQQHKDFLYCDMRSMFCPQTHTDSWRELMLTSVLIQTAGFQKQQDCFQFKLLLFTRFPRREGIRSSAGTSRSTASTVVLILVEHGHDL